MVVRVAALATSLLSIAASASERFDDDAGTKAPPISMTIALYSEPGPSWKRMAASAKAYPSVPMTAIISPHHDDNTPGASAEAGDNIEKYLAHNQTWLTAMAELRAAGIQLQHYFHMRNLTCPGGEHKCGCGEDPECCLVQGQCLRKYRCCNDISNVGVITNQSITYFPQDGFFADNGAFGNHTYEQQMHALTQVGAKKPRPVLVNGGTSDEWALQHGMSVSSEFTEACHKLPKFASKYSRDRFVAIVHTVYNASDMRRQVDNCIQLGFGNLGVVSDYTEAIPSYWEEQVAYIAKKNQELAMPR